MALQSSGQITLDQIATEFSDAAEPHALSEFYSAATGIPASGEIKISDFYGASAGTTTVTQLGTLSPTSSSSWRTQNFSISNHQGETGRFVFRYQNGASGTHYIGDFQLDYIAETISGGTPNVIGNFESGVDSFETSTISNATYTNVTSWISVATSTSSQRWNRDSGGTPSSNTGLTTAYNGSFYVYAETSQSGSSNSRYYWLRSPEITLNANANNLFFAYGALGTNLGTLTAYWVTTSSGGGGGGSGTVLSGTNNIFVTYYPVVGYGNGMVYNSTTYNGGGLSPTSYDGTNNIVGLVVYSNPGFVGGYLFTDSSSNSGWTTVTVEGDTSGYSYTANRANLSFTTPSSITGTNTGWSGFWTLNTQSGGSSGTDLYRAVNDSTGNNQGASFTITFT